MTSRQRGTGPDRSRGAVLVEFALVAPLLIALILGSITGGFALAHKNSITNASREGARFGATVPKGSAGTWAANVRDRVLQNASGDLTAAQVCVQLVNSSDTVVTGTGTSVMGAECSSITPPPLPAGVADTTPTQCVVKVWVHRTDDLNTLFFTRTLSLDAAAVVRYERGTGEACA